MGAMVGPLIGAIAIDTKLHVNMMRMSWKTFGADAMQDERCSAPRDNI